MNIMFQVVKVQNVVLMSKLWLNRYSSLYSLKYKLGFHSKNRIVLVPLFMNTMH